MLDELKYGCTPNVNHEEEASVRRGFPEESGRAQLPIGTTNCIGISEYPLRQSLAGEHYIHVVEGALFKLENVSCSYLKPLKDIQGKTFF